MNIDRKKLALLAVVVVLLGAGYFAVAASRQPDASDFKRLDSQRQAVDLSMNVYVPLFSAYTADYAVTFNEDRSPEEQAEVKQAYTETFEREHSVNDERLKAMRGSLAMKNESVKAAFNDYDAAYRAVIAYNERYERSVANVTESLAGKCDLNSNLNVASSTLGSDYAKAADACLAALKTASDNTNDDATKKLLSSVEKVVKERRDAFKQTVGQDDQLIETATKLNALASLLTINGDIKPIQDEYEQRVKQEYNELATKANASNESLKAAIEPLLNESKKEA
jgi:hypothetical protein